MWRAAKGGDVQVVAAWLDEDGSVDRHCAERDCETLLMGAAVGGKETMVRMLLKRGAGVNLQGATGTTALMYVAVQGSTTVVQALLDAKADASLRSIDGSTALILAEEEKHTATAQLLRQHAKRKGAEAEAKAATTVAHATP